MKKIDQDELALRMLEAAVGMKRPGGLTATKALDYGPPLLTSAYRRAAGAALAYFIECAGPLTIIPEPKTYPDASIEPIIAAVQHSADVTLVSSTGSVEERTGQPTDIVKVVGNGAG